MVLYIHRQLILGNMPYQGAEAWEVHSHPDQLQAHQLGVVHLPQNGSSPYVSWMLV